MDQTIKHFISKALNKPIWNIHKRVGSEFVFEVGSKIENDRGEYHFVVSSCNWWLQKQTEQGLIDIVNSESDQKRIDIELTVLDGKRLNTVQFQEDIKGFILNFENDLFLKISPYSPEYKFDQWQIFTSKQLLSFMSDGMGKIEDL